MQVEHVTLAHRHIKAMAYAVTDGVLALHPSEETFTITHIKTGYAVVDGVMWRHALDVLAAIQRKGIDFSSVNVPSDASALKVQMRAIFQDAGIPNNGKHFTRFTDG